MSNGEQAFTFSMRFLRLEHQVDHNQTFGWLHYVLYAAVTENEIIWCLTVQRKAIVYRNLSSSLEGLQQHTEVRKERSQLSQ